MKSLLRKHSTTGRSRGGELTAELAIREIDSQWTRLSTSKNRSEQNSLRSEKSPKPAQTSLMSKEAEKDKFAKQKKVLEAKIGDLESELK